MKRMMNPGHIIYSYFHDLLKTVEWVFSPLCMELIPYYSYHFYRITSRDRLNPRDKLKPPDNSSYSTVRYSLYNT
jgi:hypothetical protein